MYKAPSVLGQKRGQHNNTDDAMGKRMRHTSVRRENTIRNMKRYNCERNERMKREDKEVERRGGKMMRRLRRKRSSDLLIEI